MYEAIRYGGGFVFSGPYLSKEAADSRLEELFASGVVSESENPRVVKRYGNRWYVEVDETYPA